jgi:hypothetical protein
VLDLISFSGTTTPNSSIPVLVRFVCLTNFLTYLTSPSIISFSILFSDYSFLGGVDMIFLANFLTSGYPAGASLTSGTSCCKLDLTFPEDLKIGLNSFTGAKAFLFSATTSSIDSICLTGNLNGNRFLTMGPTSSFAPFLPSSLPCLTE